MQFLSVRKLWWLLYYRLFSQQECKGLLHSVCMLPTKIPALCGRFPFLVVTEEIIHVTTGNNLFNAAAVTALNSSSVFISTFCICAIPLFTHTWQYLNLNYPWGEKKKCTQTLGHLLAIICLCVFLWFGIEASRLALRNHCGPKHGKTDWMRDTVWPIFLSPLLAFSLHVSHYQVTCSSWCIKMSLSGLCESTWMPPF